MIQDLLTGFAACALICGTLILSYREIRKAKIERELNRLELEAKIQGMRNAKKRKVKAIKRAKARKLEAEKQKKNTVDIAPIINHVLKQEK
ncbi:MAG: hypothetical protein E4H06_02235 [Methanosarcina sp.]|nr:MAG: hypothetical protein E4H06_02235 [Methanosarcina sp.]